MKIFVQGADLRGRYEFADAPLDALAERYRSARRTCFAADFEREHRHRADCFLITAEEQLDWMLEDTEILERNLYADPARTELLQRALGVLEHERPLSREAFTGEDLTYLRGLSLATLKPGMVIAGTPPDDQLQRYVRDLHQALGRIFFYTAGKSEAHVWEWRPVRQSPPRRDRSTATWNAGSSVPRCSTSPRWTSSAPRRKPRPRASCRSWIAATGWPPAT